MGSTRAVQPLTVSSHCRIGSAVRCPEKRILVGPFQEGLSSRLVGVSTGRERLWLHLAPNSIEKETMMRRVIGLFAPVVLTFLLGPTLCFAQTGTILYVSPTRHGQSPHFSIIQKAVDAAGPGDTVRIQAGTYEEQVSIRGKNNFPGASEADRIVIEADPSSAPGDVVLKGAVHQCTRGYAIQLSRSKFVTIRGLTITGAGGQAISLMGGSNQNQAIRIERDRIYGNAVGKGPHGLSSSCDGGIVIARGNPHTLIVNNLIYGNGRNGIKFVDAQGGPHYLVHNAILANGWNGVAVARSHDVYLINNLITRNGVSRGFTGGRYGVQREGSTNPRPERIRLWNNLICGNTSGEISGPALDGTDAGNLTPKGTEGPGVSACPGCEVLANVYKNLNGPDGLPNTADDDLRLASGSCAIDRGLDPRTLGLDVPDAVFEADFSKEAARPHGNFDIGAFESDQVPYLGGFARPSAHAAARRSLSPSAAR